MEGREINKNSKCKMIVAQQKFLLEIFAELPKF
jgi:hypothetical protein